MADPDLLDDPPPAGSHIPAAGDPGAPDGPPGGPPADDLPAGDGARLWLADLRHRLPLDGRLVGWVAGALVAAGAAWWLLRPAPTPFEEAIPRAATSVATAPEAGPPGPGGGADPAEAGSTSAPEELVVHAAGAVARPGVYRLAPGGRVEDVVRAAGGLAPDADASRINLAAPLADGDRLYVPRRGEEAPPPVVGPEGGDPGGAGAPGAGGPGGAGGPIDLNTATEDELEELPGVGPATAAAIVAHRTENGPFTAVDDLIDVRGIGEAKLEQIRPLVTV